MNYIVFTQDLPGEREWLKNQLPGCRNLETISSGLWLSSQPMDCSESLIWEVPTEHKADTTMWPGQKIKSLYNLNSLEQDDRWVDSDNILFDQSMFSVAPKSQKAMLFHMPRSGTMFLQSILQKKCSYELIVDRLGPDQATFPLRTIKLSREHSVPHNPNFVTESQQNFGQIDYDIMSAQAPDVFFVYRKNWWEWITSNIVMDYTGPFHYNNVPDLNKVPPLVITENHIRQLQNMMKYTFNNLCQMRIRFRKLNFYIFEFGDLIKNQALTEHSAIKYNKKSLFVNYDEMDALFKQKYADTFELYSRRCVGHLIKTGCRTLTNFDNFLDQRY